jgi:hypothetical protein
MAVWVSAIVLFGACTPIGGPPAQVINQTTEPIAIHVDERWVGTYAPGSTTRFPLGDGSPPIEIEARSGSGHALLGVDVTADDLAEIAAGGGMSVGADLPCGHLEIQIGAVDADGHGAHPAAVGPCP